MTDTHDLTGASIKAILDALGRSAVAEVCGITAAAVRMWAVSGSVPLKHHATVLAHAHARGHTLAREDLIGTRLAATKTAVAEEVYVLADAQGNVKVGCSIGAKRRARELQWATASELTFLGTVVSRGENGLHPRLLERDLHGALWDHRVRGEWFGPPALDILTAWLDRNGYRLTGKDSA